MTIVYGERSFRYETDGSRVTRVPLEHPIGRRSTVRVGTHNARVPGPLGTTRWSRDPAGRLYQEVEVQLIDKAHLAVHGLLTPCWEATVEQLRLLDATLALVPPDHLQRLLEAKPDGFHVVSSTPRGAGISYMGGPTWRTTIR